MLDQLIRPNIVNGFLLVNVFTDLIKRLFYSLVNLVEYCIRWQKLYLRTWDGGQHLYPHMYHSWEMLWTSRAGRQVSQSRTNDAIWFHWALSFWQDWFKASFWSGLSHQLKFILAYDSFLVWSSWTEVKAAHHRMVNFHKPLHTGLLHMTKYLPPSHHKIDHWWLRVQRSLVSHRQYSEVNCLSCNLQDRNQ